MWQGINLAICWILISQWKSTRTGQGYELWKIVLCTRECSGPVQWEETVNVWLCCRCWEQNAESSGKPGWPLGRKRFPHEHQLPFFTFPFPWNGKVHLALQLCLSSSSSLFYVAEVSGPHPCDAAIVLRSWTWVPLASQGPPANPAGLSSATPPLPQHAAFHREKEYFLGETGNY